MNLLTKLLIILLTVATAGHTQEVPLPSIIDAPLTQPVLPLDMVQRCAAKVIRGDFGTVADWKLNLYQNVLDRNIKTNGLTCRTCYCPQCSGTHCADGTPVRRGVCAAPKSIKMHTILWLASDGILKVCDRGGAVQVGGGLTLASENMRIDVWVPDCPGDCWTGPGTMRAVPWAIIGFRK